MVAAQNEGFAGPHLRRPFKLHHLNEKWLREGTRWRVLRWPGDSHRESRRYTRINSRRIDLQKKKQLFSYRASHSRESPQTLGIRAPATGFIWALRAQSWKKSPPKMSSRGLSAQGHQKSKTQSKRVKIVEFQKKKKKTVEFDSFSTPFSTFWAPGSRGPGKLIFGLFLQLWARRAQMTPVEGKSFRNPTCTSQFLDAWFARKGVQFGNPETIRENQAIRENPWIDVRGSGHLPKGSKRCFPNGVFQILDLSLRRR